MKIWLDDLRPIPDASWSLVVSAENCINLLSTGLPIEEISFDHDLGELISGTGIPAKSGYDVAKYVEALAYSNQIAPFKWSVHSANGPGAENIRQAMLQADKFWRRQGLVP